MPAHATTRAARQVLHRASLRLEEALALLETAATEAPLWAHRQRTRATEILRELRVEIAGPAVGAKNGGEHV